MTTGLICLPHGRFGKTMLGIKKDGNRKRKEVYWIVVNVLKKKGP